MPKLATGANSARRAHPVHKGTRAHGFTLIEMLVVVVIVAILTGAVLLGLGRTGADQDHQRALARLSASLEIMCDQALLSGSVRGLRFHADGYDFWRYAGGRWQPLPGAARPSAVRWPAGSRPSVRIEDLQLRSAGNARLPQVVCSGIEPPTPFVVELGRGEQRLELRWP